MELSKYIINSLLSSKANPYDIINRGFISSPYLIIRLSRKGYTLRFILFDIGAEFNIVPLLYFTENFITYIKTTNLTFIAYSGGIIDLIEIIKNWIYINNAKTKNIFFIINN